MLRLQQGNSKNYWINLIFYSSSVIPRLRFLCEMIEILIIVRVHQSVGQIHRIQNSMEFSCQNSIEFS